MAHTTEIISGTCRQLLFSPKGEVEGVLMTVHRESVQVVMPAHDGAALSRMAKPGRHLSFLARRDHSHKSSEGAHPVYAFESLVDDAGLPVGWPDARKSSVTIDGTVSTLHYARHGQPNGVMLEGGEFIHLRPEGMKTSLLTVGSKVNAVGHASTTVLNTRMLEARQINGIDLR